VIRMCEKRGLRLSDQDEVLLRNVRPYHVDEEGRPSIQAFRPRQKDDGCLSIDRESMVAPATSFALQTDPRPDGFGGVSVGVWGVSLSEVEHFDVTGWADPVDARDDCPANPAHAVIDFGTADRATTSRLLWEAAIRRRRMHPCEDQSA
jgi:hypothetical protein